MEVDKTTKFNWLNIVVDDSEDYFKVLREQAEEDSQNDALGEGEPKKMSITADKQNQNTDEIYLEDGALHYSGNVSCSEGKTYVSFDLPLSQEVVTDILNETIKKYNKIKTVLEATK